MVAFQKCYTNRGQFVVNSRIVSIYSGDGAINYYVIPYNFT